MLIQDSTQRFSSRVTDYARYRPGYPPQILQILKAECGLTGSSAVADVGSGTGFLAKVFLENGNRVYGIEPNREMREEGERFLSHWPEFVSIVGTAEATTLSSKSVDLVTAGQAAHWFDAKKSRHEFLRILRLGGWLLLIWNDRAKRSNSLMDAYEQLLCSHCPEYGEVHRIDTATASGIEQFFAPAPFQVKVLPNQQILDFDALKGRLLSSSYAPLDGHPNHTPMLNELRSIFEQYAIDGRVIFAYETRMCYGRIA
jgi:SAM-dependent methyltransferase